MNNIKQKFGTKTKHFLSFTNDLATGNGNYIEEIEQI